MRRTGFLLAAVSLALAALTVGVMVYDLKHHVGHPRTMGFLAVVELSCAVIVWCLASSIAKGTE